jgi:hypothetical protein
VGSMVCFSCYRDRCHRKALSQGQTG